MNDGEQVVESGSSIEEQFEQQLDPNPPSTEISEDEIDSNEQLIVQTSQSLDNAEIDASDGQNEVEEGNENDDDDDEEIEQEIVDLEIIQGLGSLKFTENSGIDSVSTDSIINSGRLVFSEINDDDVVNVSGAGKHSQMEWWGAE